MLDLSNWQIGHIGKPSGYVIPDDAAKQNNVPAKIIARYFRRRPEVHLRHRVFRANVSEQLYQGIYIGVRL